MTDRRKDWRADEENVVMLEYIAVNAGAVREMESISLTKDISVGGARLVTDQKFAEGTLFRINIVLSRSRQNVTLFGKVKWVKTPQNSDDLYEVGVEFLHDLPETALSFIQHIYETERGVPSRISR